MNNSMATLDFEDKSGHIVETLDFIKNIFSSKITWHCQKISCHCHVKHCLMMAFKSFDKKLLATTKKGYIFNRLSYHKD